MSVPRISPRTRDLTLTLVNSKHDNVSSKSWTLKKLISHQRLGAQEKVKKRMYKKQQQQHKIWKNSLNMLMNFNLRSLRKFTFAGC